MERVIGTLIVLKLASMAQAFTNMCDGGNPCGASGTCVPSSPSGYTCSCYPGYVATPQKTKCVDRNECSLSPHLCNNGTCLNTQGSFSCRCNNGYAGSHCRQKTNPCESSPCLNGGRCTQTSTSMGYTCSCYAGFMQPNCQDRDECSIVHNLCHNGTCKNTPGSFRCVCNAGYSGSHCTINTNPCASSPCRNGKCSPSSSPDGYMCSCYSGFVPPDCADRDECAMVSTLCGNGTCMNTQGSFHCTCNDGFSGSHCRQKTDPCSSSPCLNGGKCSGSASGYTCSCLSGYSLPNCQDKNECALVSNLCHNGTCVNTPGSYKCNCNEGFTGIHCTIQILTTVVTKPVTTKTKPGLSTTNSQPVTVTKLHLSTTSLHTSLNHMRSTLSGKAPSGHIASLGSAQDKTNKKAWASSHWWVFVVTVAVVGIAAIATVIIVRKRRVGSNAIYNKFSDSAPSTPTSPTPLTQENPLYMALHVHENNKLETSVSPKPVQETNGLFMDLQHTDNGVSEI